MKSRTLRLRRLRDRATAALAAVGAVTLVAGSVVMITSGTASAEDEDHKVSICHATGSATNPYERGVGGIPKEQITAADGHGGDVANHPGDIIPAFAAGSHGGQSWPAFEGRNLELLHVLSNGCRPVPVIPQIDDDDQCGTENDTVTGVPRNGYTFQVDGDTVTFTANDGYYLDGPTTLRADWSNVPCAEGPPPVDLKLTYIVDCGLTTNKWRVRNPSDEAIEVSYGAYAAGASRTHTATPGDSFFTTPYGSETMKMSWGDDDTIAKGSTTKASGGDADDCEGPQAPVTPEIEWDDPCGTANDMVEGVVKDGYTFVVDDETGRVTFTAKEGYVLDGPSTLKATWTDKPCPRYATPTDPEVDESQECEVEGTFSIPDTSGVQYFLDGDPIDPGTYDGPVDGLLTAQPVGRTVLTEDDWAYDMVLDEAEECDEALPDEETDDDTDTSAGDKPDEVKGVAQERPRPTRPAVAPTGGGVAPTVLPTSVNAGLGATADTVTEPRSGLGLLLAGFGMLLVAGSLQVGRRQPLRSEA